MTLKEKALEISPELYKKGICPCTFGFNDDCMDGRGDCEKCWNKEYIEDAIKPDYYNDTKIAPIDVIEDWDLDFCLGSALKYIKRCGKKDNNPSVQDLRKVIWYVERRIKELEEASECQ